MRRCSTAVKSVPNGNTGSKRASAAGLSARAIMSGVLSRTAFGSSKSRAILPASFASRNNLAVAFAAQIGNAVFGDDDIAQMARNGGVAITPKDVGLILAIARPDRAQHDRRTRVFKRKALCDEIVLPTDAADDAAVVETVGDHVAEQRCHHRVIKKAGFDAGAALFVLVAVDLVDEGNPGHAEFLRSLGRHLAKAAVEIPRADEETGMQHDAGDLALEDAGAKQVEHALDEQFGAAIQADIEAPAVNRCVAPRVVTKRRQ